MARGDADKGALGAFMERARMRAPGQTRFHDVLEAAARRLLPVETAEPRFAEARVLERLSLPDRVIGFRVVWRDDAGELQLNRGWRVQTSSLLGPCKGGLRFGAAVDEDTLKALGFEQTLKNSLTGLTLGGAKGGADFDPRGRSPAEVERFCHALMAVLGRELGPDRDLPAGDMNVGPREIGWLFGAWKRQTGRFDAALTGKSAGWGGSLLRPEATGHGAAMFLRCMAAHAGSEIEGMRIALSGAGSVALPAAAKAAELGARPLTLSDTSGALYAPDGLSAETLAEAERAKAAGEGLDSLADGKRLRWHEDETPWSLGLEADAAMPCAVQREIDGAAARSLAEGGVRWVAEGANMPLTADAEAAFAEAGAVRAPGKAANAGGVVVSALEMSQNATGLPWTRARVADTLADVMRGIHYRCVEAGVSEDAPGGVDYALGADVAAYRRLAEAAAAQGSV